MLGAPLRRHRLAAGAWGPLQLRRPCGQRTPQARGHACRRCHTRPPPRENLLLQSGAPQPLALVLTRQPADLGHLSGHAHAIPDGKQADRLPTAHGLCSSLQAPSAASRGAAPSAGQGSLQLHAWQLPGCPNGSRDGAAVAGHWLQLNEHAARGIRATLKGEAREGTRRRWHCQRGHAALLAAGCWPGFRQGECSPGRMVRKGAGDRGLQQSSVLPQIAAEHAGTGCACRLGKDVVVCYFPCYKAPAASPWLPHTHTSAQASSPGAGIRCGHHPSAAVFSQGQLLQLPRVPLPPQGPAAPRGGEEVVRTLRIFRPRVLAASQTEGAGGRVGHKLLLGPPGQRGPCARKAAACCKEIFDTL